MVGNPKLGLNSGSFEMVWGYEIHANIRGQVITTQSAQGAGLIQHFKMMWVYVCVFMPHIYDSRMIRDRNNFKI